MKTRIHVNQQIIKRNKATGEDAPPLTIKRRGRTTVARKVVIHGPSVVVYRPEKPLDCGARVWIETDAEVEIS